MTSVRLRELRFNPLGGCVTQMGGVSGFERGPGVYFDIVTGAIKSETIAIVDGASGGMKIAVNTPASGGGEVGGSMGVTVGEKTTWNGVSLFLGRMVSRYFVKKTGMTCELKAGVRGGVCALRDDGCVFAVSSIKDDAWSGRVSCGRSGEPIDVEFSDQKYQKIIAVGSPSSTGTTGADGTVALGRTMTFMVVPSQADSIKVDFTMWTTTEGSSYTVGHGGGE